MGSKPQPIIRFDPSQRDPFFDDPARVIVVNFHRQKGKDFTAAAKAIDQAMRDRQDWFIVGLTQAQADETFNKCKRSSGR
jgi:ABC-type tungstate transport system permease subunit